MRMISRYYKMSEVREAILAALSILRGVKSLFNVEAIEDTFCYLLDKEIFLDLLKKALLCRPPLGKVFK